MKSFIQKILESIHLTGSFSSIFGTENIGKFLILSLLSITNSPIFLIFVIVLLVFIFFKIRRCHELKIDYDKCEKAKTEEYSNVKGQLCYFITKCKVLNEDKENILAPYFNRENAYFGSIAEMNNAIEKCKNCAIDFEQLHKEKITRLESELSNFSNELENQKFKVFIDCCKEDKNIACAIQEYLEENKIHCTQSDRSSSTSLNSLRTLQFLDTDTIVIFLYYDEKTKITVKKRLEDYKHISLKLTEKKQFRVLIFSSNRNFISLFQNMQWFCTKFSPKTCYKIKTQIEGLTNE